MRSLFLSTSFLLLLILFVGINAPPPPRNVDGKTKEEMEKKSVPEIDEDDLPKYEFHYSKYLEKIVQILESDPRFNEKIRTLNDEELRSGKIADHFDIISDDVARELTKAKLQEVERLRQAIQKQIEEDNGAHNIKAPEHIDIDQLDKFHAEDLRKLIKKTYEDMTKIDKERQEKFKKYEMEKQAKYEHELANLPEEERQKLKQKHEEAIKRHKEHEKINHPGDRQQLEEVWEEKDNMPKENFEPKTFFALHDLNSDGFWNIGEIDALFQLELNKLYNDTNPDDDPKEKIEEMYRMRDHVLNQMDKNKDRMISLEEFLADNEVQASTKSPEEWVDIADTKVYSDIELQKFEEEYAKEQGWGPDAYKIESTIVPSPTTPSTTIHGEEKLHNTGSHQK
uniref:EF-hand domain-containing protein n=1 Tax=Strongyloides papillosus TaxID=174720 RepID=A0A0N5C4A8_STREA